MAYSMHKGKRRHGNDKGPDKSQYWGGRLSCTLYSDPEAERQDPQEIFIMNVEWGWVEPDFKGHFMVC